MSGPDPASDWKWGSFGKRPPPASRHHITSRGRRSAANPERSGHGALRDRLALAVITGLDWRVTEVKRHIPFHRKETTAAILPSN